MLEKYFCTKFPTSWDSGQVRRCSICFKLLKSFSRLNQSLSRIIKIGEMFLLEFVLVFLIFSEYLIESLLWHLFILFRLFTRRVVKMAKLTIAVLISFVGLIAAQAASPVPQALGVVSVPSVNDLAIPPPGYPSSQSVQKILRSQLRDQLLMINLLIIYVLQNDRHRHHRMEMARRLPTETIHLLPTARCLRKFLNYY